MHCYTINGCSAELRSKCDAFVWGQTTDLKCRAYGPIAKAGKGDQVFDLDLKCYTDCKYFEYYLAQRFPLD